MQQPESAKTGIVARLAAGVRALAARFIALPRLVRIVLVAIFALGWVLLLFAPVDMIYFYNFFSMDTRILPSYVSAGIGLLVYFIGWYLLVGTIGQRLQPKLSSGIYIVLGVGVLLLDVILIISGLVIQATSY